MIHDCAQERQKLSKHIVVVQEQNRSYSSDLARIQSEYQELRSVQGFLSHVLSFPLPVVCLGVLR